MGLAVALIGGSLVFGDSLAAPNAVLVGATLREARNFAVDLAYGRGWSVPSVGRTSAEFEQVIEDDDPNDPDAPRLMIRVTARFIEEPTGVRVMLEAQEIATRDLQVSTQDVSARYAENLGNALRSLVAKWDERLEVRGGEPRADVTEPMRHPPMQFGWEPAGAWASDAERYAQNRGCVVDSNATRLEAHGSSWEDYRVPCGPARSMRIRCEHGLCRSQP